MESGHSERIVTALRPLEYDISRDGRQLVMQAPDREGKPRLWTAAVDGSSPPQQIANIEGQNPSFGNGGEIFFRQIEGSSSFVYSVQPDGTALGKVLDQSVFYAGRISPDGRWMRVWGPIAGRVSAGTQLLSLDGGDHIVIGSNTILEWSSTGDCLWISSGPVPDGRTYIIPLQRGKMLPQIPEGGFHSEEEVAALPGARRLDVEGAPGPSLDIYAFERHTIQRNLYRIPIP